MAASQDLLVAKTGKVPATLEGSDFEFVTKVEIEKVNDIVQHAGARSLCAVTRIAGRAAGAPMDIQVNTIDLDAGNTSCSSPRLTARNIPSVSKILPSPPHIANAARGLKSGHLHIEFNLKGRAAGSVEPAGSRKGSRNWARQCHKPDRTQINPAYGLGHRCRNQPRNQGYIKDRSEPLTLADAVRVVGRGRRITELKLYQLRSGCATGNGELPAEMYLSAMIRVQHLQSNSTCEIGLRTGRRH